MSTLTAKEFGSKVENTTELPLLDEQKMLDLLRAWMEEWGGSRMTLLLPVHWKKCGLTVHGVTTHFCTQRIVSLSVDCGNNSRLEYTARVEH